MTGSGQCPACGLPILIHTPDERKHCHDALSGFTREQVTQLVEEKERHETERLSSRDPSEQEIPHSPFVLRRRTPEEREEYFIIQIAKMMKERDDEKDLADDLATVMSHVVVGWKEVIGVDLAQHPSVQRVMKRYRIARGREKPDG